jgi:hypothetical protein
MAVLFGPRNSRAVDKVGIGTVDVVDDLIFATCTRGVLGVEEVDAAWGGPAARLAAYSFRESIFLVRYSTGMVGIAKTTFVEIKTMPNRYSYPTQTSYYYYFRSNI